MADEKADFIQAWAESVASGSFVKLTLGKPDAALTDIKKVVITPVTIQDKQSMRVVTSRAANDMTKNMALDAATAEASRLIGQALLSATLFTTDADCALIYNKRGEPRLTRAKPTQVKLASHAHNRQKNYVVEASRPYLKHLGVTLDDGRVKPSMYAKFRQICHFIEIIDDLLRASPLKDVSALSVVDIGSGKGYLTFALYDYLTAQLEKNVAVIGVEARSDLAQFCAGVAAQLNFKGLSFEAERAERTRAASADLLIALHACDTATDDAIANGILANASLIVCAPCCQHELAPQLAQPDEALAGLMKFGLFKQRQADLVTDAARCLLLEASGYKVKVIEFVSTEHTAKNILIAGIRSNDVDRSAARRQYDALKTLMGFRAMRLEQRLAKL
ncbi:MAG: class I SAM-dependent methyltransferase [Hyphomicrobium sp.]